MNLKILCGLFYLNYAIAEYPNGMFHLNSDNNVLILKNIIDSINNVTTSKCMKDLNDVMKGYQENKPWAIASMLNVQ